MKRIWKLFILAIAIVLFVAGSVLGYLHATKDKRAMEADFERIASTEFNTAFLSMYPIDSYNEEDFSYFREMELFKTGYSIPDAETLHNYVNTIFSTGNEITTLYLGIHPEAIDPYEIYSLIELYPGLEYKILLATPTLDYWAALPEETFLPTLESYSNFVNLLLPLEQVEIYSFFNAEWLITNPANYVSDFGLNKAASRVVFLNADSDHGYLITMENVEDVFIDFTEIVQEYRNEPPAYPDLSEYELVFFGDSVIGNYEVGIGIPGMVGGFTNASFHNLGHGGASAAQEDADDTSFPKLVNALISKDVSLLDPEANSTINMITYHDKWFKERNKCFVISFGLNDFFEGHPVDSTDPYDISTYSGALRTGIKALQEKYPDAYILVLTPNFTIINDFGASAANENGGVLLDYVDAAIAVAEEMNVDVLDIYRELDIDAKNQEEYLEDGTHPNMSTRLEISRMIVEVLEKLATVE